MYYLTDLIVCCLILLECSYAAIYTDKWAVHIQGGERVARSLARDHGFVYLGEIMPDYYHFHHRRVSKRSALPSHFHHATLAQEPEVRWLEQQVVKRRVKRDAFFNDPKWPRMWYLNRGTGLDMNVIPAWHKGYTGKGIVVSILDDGIEKDHPDLKLNYDPDASYDVNGHDADPQPRYDYTNENRHGTRCAGEVAAMAGNGICSVGVAYNASIGGVRMLDGDVTDAVEARSLSHHPQHIDIYSASWGPDDDGRTVDGPATLAKKAFLDGIEKGRGGLGSIFVWASGNGGRDDDSCNCDGYTNSIYTLSISSATENGKVPWYSEACSSTLATTYSSGSGNERQIVTTDLRKGCTETHTGTSASAPLAAGICALALQANPHMTWRDMQHIVVMTARPDHLTSADWVTNGVGRRVSHSFGYGLMDAAAMTELAKNWTNVPQQHSCKIDGKDLNRGISINGKLEVTIESDGCEGNPHDRVVYLEHVQAAITLSATRRGEVQIFLVSPQGTRSTLLARRLRDTSTEGFNNWKFMTTHNWGEIAMGRWTLEIENGHSRSELKTWSLIMYGTATHPQRGHQAQARPNPYQPVCKPGKYFLNNFCYDSCPANFYAVTDSVAIPINMTDSTTGAPVSVTSSSPVSGATEETVVGDVTDSGSNGTKTVVMQLCKQCHQFCRHCFGSELNECTECTHGYMLSTNHTCVRMWFGIIDYNMMPTIVIVLVVCGGGILFFWVVFFLLQLKDGAFSCRRKGYLDSNNKVQYNGIRLQHSDDKTALLSSDETDDEIWDTENNHTVKTTL